MTINLLSTEILKEIFEYLIRPHELYACVLVCREWCKVAIPILWRTTIPPNYDQPDKTVRLLVQTYLLCLPKEKIRYLKDKKMPFPAAPRGRPPLFDYPFFLRLINFDLINNMANIWIVRRKMTIDSKFYYINLLKQTLIDLFLERAEMLHFIYHDGGLRAPMFNKDAPNLQKLKIVQYSSSFSEDRADFLNSISTFSTKLQHIIARNKASFSYHEHANEVEALSNLVKCQINLHHITLIGYSKNLSAILKSLRSQSNWIKKLDLIDIDFKYLDESAIGALVSCRNLEYLEIDNCDNANDNYLKPMQIMFPKLSRFKFMAYWWNCKFPLDFFIKIIISANTNLRHISIPFQQQLSFRPQITMIITKHCSQLQHLHLSSLGNFEILMILDSCQQLRELKFNTDTDFGHSTFIDMATHVPSTLQHWYIRICAPNFPLWPDTLRLFLNTLSNSALKVFQIIHVNFGDECNMILTEHGIKPFYDGDRDPFDIVFDHNKVFWEG